MHHLISFVRVFLLSLLMVYVSIAVGQPLTVSPSLLDFGTITVGNPDSLQLSITNPTTDTISITGIRSYSIYDSLIYRLNTTGLTLLPGASTDVWVHFAPEHNIQHPSQLVLLTDSDRGSVSVALAGQGVFANPYYASTQNLHEEALKNALKTRITQGYQQLSYNGGRDEMYMVIDNQRLNGQGASVNTLVGVYTGFTVTSYTSRTDAQLQGFNTEHTFPQGFFNQNLPMRSDIHHLFPTKIAANSERGNKPFGNVTNPTWQDGGSKSNGSLFEPRDDHKGPTARCMLYFVLRYQNYQGFLNSQESVLRQWHAMYPPLAKEVKRNNGIFAVQNNRSPFVDYPQLLDRIHSIGQNSVAPANASLNLTEDVIDYGTVFGNSDVDYFYVVVNNGNTTLSLTDFTLGDPQLSFAPGSGADITLEPGGAHTVVVRLNMAPNASLSSTLSVNTGSTQGVVQVPIQAVSEGPNAVSDQLIQRVEVYPNPVAEYISVVWDNQQAGMSADSGTLSLLNARGQFIATYPINASTGSLKIPTHSLSAGIYLLRINQGGQQLVKKIRVQ